VDTAVAGPIGRDTALVTRLVVVDAVLLALVAAYVAWASRTNSGSHVTSFSGPKPQGRARPVRAAVTGVVAGGVVLGSAGYGLGTRLLNILAFFALMSAVYAGGAALHNRALDRR